MRTAPVAHAFAREGDGYRRPIVLLSYAAQARLGIDSPAALHAVNIGLHAANGVLLFLLCLGLGVPATVAAAGTAVFSAHPLGSAAVAYISGRTDLLAAFFALLALHVTLLADKRGSADAARPQSAARGLACAAAVAFCVACAALSKESGLVAGPLVAGLWWLERRTNAPLRQNSSMRARALSIPVSAIVTSVALAPVVAPPAVAASASVGFQTHVRAAGAALSAYARLVVRPTDLHLDRLTEVAGAFDPWVGVMALCAFVIAIAAFVLRPTSLRFAFAAVAVLALPASNLLPIYPAIAEHWVFTGEQLAYLPLAPLAVLAACALARLCETAGSTARVREALVLAATLAAVGLSIAPVSARQAELSDPIAVYRNTLARSPSPRACFNLGVALLGGGKPAEAAAVYERCVKISPHDAKVYVQLGVAYQRSGQRNRAEISYAKALELDPTDPYAWSNYAGLEATAGFYAEARAKWQRALELRPGFAPALEGLRKLQAISAGAPAPRPPS